MKRWEYKVIDSQDVDSGGMFKGRQRSDIEAYLCELGRVGWEIINLTFRQLEGRFEFSGIARREKEA
ncbi:MAG: hypothetical protein ABGY72_18390 [bacterium]|nr:hypothetical protein [Gemmatimonadota bacterium]